MSLLDKGGGIRRFFAVWAKMKNTRRRVRDEKQGGNKAAVDVRVENKALRTPCTSIAKTVQKNRRNKNERITENQNQA